MFALPALDAGPLMRVVIAFAWARVLLASGALVSAVFLPGVPRDRLMFAVLVGVVALPYTVAVLLLTRRDRRYGASLATMSGDVAVVFLMQTGFPATRPTGYVSYMLLIGFYTPIAGASAGFTLVGLGMALSALAQALEPAGAFNTFTFLLFGAAATALTVVVASATRQELEVARRRVSTVSHELRGPLTSIEGFASTLAERWTEIEDRKRMEYLSRIRRNAASVHEIVKTFLESPGVGAIEPAVAVIPLAGFVHELCDACAPMLLDRDVGIHIPPELSVAADPALLERVLVNLVLNAHGYSPPAAPIDVEATPGPAEVIVSVRDRGPGIRPADRDRIFDSFWRPGGQSRRGRGIGLGLVREIVTAMGGRVWVDSEPGEGAVFSFSLPRSDRGRVAG